MTNKILMSKEFHIWLDQCPVQWFRGEVDESEGFVEYSFEIPDEEDESPFVTISEKVTKED